MIALTGATGAVGGRVAELLRDLPLRLVVRDASRAPDVDAEIVVADFDDSDALRRAFDGVDTLLFVSAAESATRREQHRNVVSAAREAGVQHVVYTSFIGAAADATFTLARDHHDAEQALADGPFQTTILRDNEYLDILPFFADDHGVIRGPAGDGRFAGVARADVADVAAAVLRDPTAHAGEIYELTGPEALTMTEVAERLTTALRREFRFENETPQEAYDSRRAAYPDTPDWEIEAWTSSYTAIADGVLADVTGDVERVTGHPPRSLEDAVQGQ